MEQTNNNDFISSVEEFYKNEPKLKKSSKIATDTYEQLIVTGVIFILSSLTAGLSLFVEILTNFGLISIIAPYIIVALLLALARPDPFTKKYFINIILIFILLLLVFFGVMTAYGDGGWGALAIVVYGFFVVVFINVLIGLSLLITGILKNKNRT